MKAFVIKNEEGEYFIDNYRWTNKLCNAYIFEFKKDAIQIKDICLLSKDCKIIKITMVEGDLEQENKQLKELRKLEVEDKKELRENRLQEVIKLEKELVEKDKEIEEYKTQIKEFCGTKFAKLIDKKEQEIRKQVCGKIKEKLKAHCDYTDEEHIGWYISEEKIDILLNKIEKGE